MSVVPDGIALMYVKSGVLYPVALKKDDYETLSVVVASFGPLKVVDQPQGKAINLREATDNGLRHHY